MANVNSILNERMKKPSNVSKMAAMAQQSASGNLTSFSGVFGMIELSSKEKDLLATILDTYGDKDQNIQQDLEILISLTSEVKAINNQAALLHGERIKKAHQILTRYRDGAFTAWLMAAYGNRQTPYNLMQYYEFCEAMPKQLRSQIEIMPRQAVYVLASREGTIEKKKTVIENYQGETKAEMLALIRQLFPLKREDKRQQKIGTNLVQGFERLYQQLKRSPQILNSTHKKQLRLVIQQIQQLLGTYDT